MDPVDNLIALHEHSARLLMQLKQSLAIQALWPEAFDAGPVTAQVRGSRLQNPGEMIFTLTRSDEVSREFSLKDVPAILWPDPVKKR